MGLDPSGDFWGWCLRVYADPGVARAALRLQDRNGACVMLLLCLCWRATRGAADGPAQLAVLQDRTALAEQHLLVPLRAARRALLRAGRSCPASQATAPGRALLDAELVLERLQAGRLARCSVPGGAPGCSPGHDAEQALGHYLRSLGTRKPRDHAVARVLARRALGAQPG